MKPMKRQIQGTFDKGNIKAILIDSGRVLNGPVAGEWFITPNFFNYIDKTIFDSIDKPKINEAFNSAGNYISKQNLIVTIEDEYKHFLKYYKILFEKLPEIKMNKEKIEAITRDLVYNSYKYEFYKDVIEIIPRLSEKYKLALVSDAWPSLENVFKQAGLRKYFSSFIISSVKGVTKPNRLMYISALNELDVSADEAIFIDDSIINCNEAKQIGINSFVLCRDWKTYIENKFKCKGHIVIRNLNDISKIIL